MAAVVACCALLPAIGVGAGVAAAVAGAAVRYWPLTLVGIVVLVWSGVGIARVLRGAARPFLGTGKAGPGPRGDGG